MNEALIYRRCKNLNECDAIIYTLFREFTFLFFLFESLIYTSSKKQRYKNDSFFTPSLLFLVFCRSRNTEAVCAGLQAQILSCYRDNKDQTLKCSDLAKEYMQCINAAKKVRAFHKSAKI